MRFTTPWARPLLCLVGLLCCVSLLAGERVIDDRDYHLGVAGFPEWAEFRDSRPHGRELRVEFDAAANAGAMTLLVTQDNVPHGWSVNLNGRRLGFLERAEQKLVAHFRVPPGALKAGSNRLDILAPKQVDDIRVGPFRLLDGEPEEALGASGLRVTVTEAPAGKPVPCRITVVDANGALAALTATDAGRNRTDIAVRAGVIYTLDGRARIGLRPGDYTVYASRGFEYGVATNQVRVSAGAFAELSPTIRREVATPGMVSIDPHIHTLTHSGHGDATLAERMITIAGEDIELPVATDHNTLTDYRGPARDTGALGFFTPVTGNEVTTKHGHFNAFPIADGAPLPDHTLTNWTKLIGNIRATPGVRVVSLNHPRNVHSGFSPTGGDLFDPLTAAGPQTDDFVMDAMEVLTSAAMQSDVMLPIRDWFALLNYGHRITGLGSSDTHDVNRYILGQGRTYALCADGDPAAIDVEAACESLRRGRALISFGLLTDIVVNDRHRVGDQCTETGKVRVRVTVRGPSWVRADRVEVFANGRLVACSAIASSAEATKRDVEFSLGPFPHDVFLVAVATGPGVTAPFWDTPRPYQPASKEFTPRFLGATNPVWIDADGDGSFTPAREYARRLQRQGGGEPDRLERLFLSYDAAVAAQVRALSGISR